MKFIIGSGVLLFVVAQTTATSLRENLISQLGNEPCTGSSVQGATTCGSNNYCLCGQPPNNVNAFCNPGLCYPGNLRDETPLCVYNVQCQSGVCQNLGNGNSQCGPTTTQRPLIPCGNTVCTTGQLCLPAQAGQPQATCVTSCALTGSCGVGGTCYQGQYCLASGLQNGDTCLTSAQCSSNNCRNNVCAAVQVQCGSTFCQSGQVCVTYPSSLVQQCLAACTDPNSNICNNGNGFCSNGACMPLNLPIGSSCLTSGQCVGSNICTSNVCTAPQVQCGGSLCPTGQSCFTYSNQAQTCVNSCQTGCSGNYFCYENAFCLPLNQQIGQPCQTNTQCAAGNCQQGICTSPSQPCAQTSCTSGQVCNINNQGVGTCYTSCANSGICTANTFCYQGSMCLPVGLSAGQPCLTNSQCTSSQCGQSGVCLAPCGNSFCQASQICMVAPGSGGQSTCFTACSPSMPCPGSSSNVCVQANNPNQTGLGGCLPGNLPPGSACQTSQQCSYGNCQNSVCQSW